MNIKIKHPRSFWSLLGLIVLFQVIGAGIGMITAGEIDGWYQTIQKSALTPPGYLFGVVWSILYFFLAIITWRLLHLPEHAERRNTLKLFIGHMVLNWGWSIVFFKMHALVVSFATILIIFTTAVYFAVRFYGSDKVSFALIVPYILWLIFAGYLSFYIVLYN